ncbi:MAG: diphosphomevalonate decarboxylase [Flavobacteriaceae bacterium]|nr:diphosphomevalonate decarboxylase [Bacteroidia bacterium]NNL61767.1 diphosphomevalonate decarboxylase [Flavobacteriaceae bacterium]RZV69587.1 MAG: diphosphomevalonate decarboxylase [Flavobacteriaceae bacterium]
MIESDFASKPIQKKLNSGAFTWKAPSNIALVKYWGKKQDQIPENASLSFTLDACRTTTTLEFEKLEDPVSDFSFDVYFDGKLKEDFKPKIETFFTRIENYLTCLKDYHFTIRTANTFPHSSGIASSASGMGALALCLMSMQKEMHPEMDQEYFNKKASFLARLGSGSASRSIEGDVIVWGKHDGILGSSDLFATKFPNKVHTNFKNYHDTILLIDKGEKQVSSTVGHGLMHGHPFAQERFKQATSNLSKLSEVLQNGDLKAFIKIVESEALTLHAMMMSSTPYFILMRPNTLEVINRIWEFRQETGTHVCFTLDAGANVHVLYPEKEAEEVYEFIKSDLVAYCQNGHYICDRVGLGAKQMY